MNFRISHWTLRSKIILHIVVVGFVAASILAYVYISTQKNMIKQMNIQRMTVISSLLEYNISLHMQKGTPENVQVILQQLTTFNSIRNIRILDSNGKVVKSSDPKEAGTNIQNTRTLNILKQYALIPDKDLFFLRSVSSAQSLIPIRNKKECQTCHSPEKPYHGILEVSLDDSDTIALLKQNYLTSILITIIALVVLIFIILRLFEKIINRPFSELKDRIRAVREGNLDIQIIPRKDDEIGNLTQSFSSMVKDLKDAKQKIAKLHSREMEKAEHLALMGELAAGLAHEIKNPIAGIKGALEIIHDQSKLSDPKREIFKEILIQTERIQSIVQDLLSYARPKKIELKHVNPDPCIQGAVNLALSQIKEKEIQIEYTGLEESIQVLLDENKIQEVVLNLILNSIAAIEDKGQIFVRAGKKKDEFTITVKDNGKGIIKKNLPQIFQPFYTTRKKGTGLGLSICKRIIEEHNGSFEVISEEKEGTEFIIHLPIHPSEEPL